MSFGLGLLITIIFFVLALNGGENPDRFNFGLGIAIALAVLCAVLMLLFGLYQIVTNPKGSMKGLLTFGILVGLFVAMYATAKAGGSASLINTEEEFGITEGTSKLISAGMMTTFLLILATLGSFVLSEVRNFFK